MMHAMQIVACQTDIAWEDREENFSRVRAMLASRRPAPGALVVLPEMFASGFSMNVPAIAEAEDGATTRFLAELAREMGVFTLGGLVGRGPDGKGQNLAVACAPDGAVIARYQKIHPFSFGAEHEHFTGGERIVTFAWGGFTVAPLVCYDLRFPEAFRMAVRAGATLYCVIANWPAARLEHWLTLLRARAIENQAYVVGVNRVGADPQVAYAGRTLVVDPRGEVLADGQGNEGLISAEIDPSVVADYRRQFPALQDIRLRFPPRP
jgi:predicted amidohydrolase